MPFFAAFEGYHASGIRGLSGDARSGLLPVEGTMQKSVKAAAKGQSGARGKKRGKERTAAVVVRVDPKLKREYARLAADIARASANEKKDFDLRWEAAMSIVEHSPPLYLAAGIASVEDFYRDVMHEEPRQAERFIRVAKFASPAEEELYGVSKLEAAIAFVKAKLGTLPAHPPLPVAFNRLRIPVKTGTKALADASVAEIRAATSALLGKGSKRPRSAAHGAITKSLGAVASLRDVATTERDGFLTFQRVPVAAFEHFIRALGKAHAQLGA